MYNPIQLTNTTPTVRTSKSRPCLRRGLPRKQPLPRIQAISITRGLLLIPLAVAWFALPATARADDCEQGCDFLFRNTFLGQEAFVNNIGGLDNTANGAYALNNNTTGVSNTANGWQALFGNTTGNNNTANGLDALLSNTTGFNNTANGVLTLGFNTTGSSNTATGISALQNNTSGA